METDTARVGAIAALDSDDTRSELIAHYTTTVAASSTPNSTGCPGAPPR
jgi:hypothetical protein